MNRNRIWLPLVGIAGALAVWAGLLAVGAYWSGSGEFSGHDERKLWVVAGTTAVFLAIWGGAVWLGRRRIRARQAAGVSQAVASKSSVVDR